MTEKDRLLLSDKDVIPTEELVNGLLGDKVKLWKSIHAFLDSGLSGYSGQWNWYNDGKQWLYKLTFRKKTIFWAALYEDTFRITFYFGDKAEKAIVASRLPAVIKDMYLTGKRYGKIRAVSINPSEDSDIENIRQLIDIKLKAG